MTRHHFSHLVPVIAVALSGCVSYRTGMSVAPDGVREAVLIYQLSEQIARPTSAIFVSVWDPPRTLAPSHHTLSRLAQFKAKVFVPIRLTSQPETEPATTASINVFFRLERRYRDPDQAVVLGSFTYGTEENGVSGAYRYQLKRVGSEWVVQSAHLTHLDSDCYGNIWVTGPSEP